MTIMWVLHYNVVSWAWGFTHPPYRDLSSIEHAVKLGTIALPFWAWATGLVKISIACMLLKFQQARRWRAFVCAIIVLNVFLIGFMGVANMFACIPYAAIWDMTGKYKETRKCWGRAANLATVYVTCICNVCSDVSLSLVPLTFLGKVRRPLREKVVIGTLMALGLVASVFSIGRMVIQLRKDHFPDKSAQAILQGLLTCLEVQHSLIAACIPMLRSSANRWLSRLGLWRGSVGEGGTYQRYGEGRDASEGKAGSRRVMELNEVSVGGGTMRSGALESSLRDIRDSAHESGQFIMDPVTGRIMRVTDVKEHADSPNVHDEFHIGPGQIMQDKWESQRDIGYAW